MKTRLIISRFKENLDWLAEFKNLNILIYNKGNEIKKNNLENIINIKNVGRESHTWIYHIVNNYFELDDISIFMQGRIDDLGCMAYQNPNLYLIKVNKTGFAASRYGILTPLHWSYNIGIENNNKYMYDWNNKNITGSEVGFRSFAKELFPEIPKFVKTSYGGCFAVKKELIQKHTLNFYINILDKLNKSQNPIEGHFMERLWCYLFTKNKFFNEAISDVILTKLERSPLNLFKN